MEKLHALRDDPRWDIVMLDTPPTAHALDFLDAPERLIGAIDSPAIRWFVQAFEGTGKLSFNLLARSTATLLRGLGKLTGGGFLEQVAAFISEMNALFGGWKKRADAVSAALRGPEVAYVLVTTPDPLAIREVGYFAERLRSERMHADAFVVNRVNPAFSTDATHAVQSLSALGIGASPDFAAKCEAALRDASLLARLDRIHLMSLEPIVEDARAPLALVPTFARDVYDLEALRQIGDILAP